MERSMARRCDWVYFYTVHHNSNDMAMSERRTAQAAVYLKPELVKKYIAEEEIALYTTPDGHVICKGTIPKELISHISDVRSNASIYKARLAEKYSETLITESRPIGTAIPDFNKEYKVYPGTHVKRGLYCSTGDSGAPVARKAKSSGLHLGKQSFYGPGQGAASSGPPCGGSAQGVGWPSGPGAGVGVDVDMDIGDGTLGNAGVGAGSVPAPSPADNPTLWTPKVMGCGPAQHPLHGPGVADQSSSYWSVLVYRAAPSTLELVPRIVCSRCGWVYPTGVMWCLNVMCAEPLVLEAINDLHSNRTQGQDRVGYMAKCGLLQGQSQQPKAQGNAPHGAGWHTEVLPSGARLRWHRTLGETMRLDQRARTVHRYAGGHPERYDTDWEYYVWCQRHGVPRVLYLHEPHTNKLATLSDSYLQFNDWTDSTNYRRVCSLNSSATDYDRTASSSTAAP